MLLSAAARDVPSCHRGIVVFSSWLAIEGRSDHLHGSSRQLLSRAAYRSTSTKQQGLTWDVNGLSFEETMNSSSLE